MSGKGLVESGFLVSTAEICEIIGLSSRRIQQLTDEGALVRASHGKYDLRESIKAYLDWQKKKLVEEDEDLNKTREETLWIRARRKKSEAEYSIMSGTLHRSTDIEDIMNAMMSSFRSQLLAFPNRAAGKIVGEADVRKIQESLKDDMYEVMQELSDYDPTIFYENSDDKIYIEDPEEGGVVKRT